MARYWFGQTLTDWTMVLGSSSVESGVTYAPVQVAGPVAVTMWSAETGGVQYTDLLDASGAPITSVTSADGTGTLPPGTIPQFQGPDDVTAMWADAGAGVRYRMLSSDLGAVVAAQQTELDNLANIVTNVESLTENIVLAVVYDEVASAWPERPATAGDRPVYWHGPNASPPPAGYMRTNDQFFGWT